MRVVLDTNVVMSGIFFGGAPGKILAAWSAGGFSLVLSPPILEEYRRVGRELAEKTGGADISGIIDLIVVHAEFVAAPVLEQTVCRDPDDDKFLACAAAVGALLVSGDKDLLAISGVMGVEVLTPRRFLDRLTG